MNRNIMVKAIPLNAKPTLKLDAKNEAKVKATKERLARSSSFSAYNLRWNSFISISEGGDFLFEDFEIAAVDLRFEFL